MRSSGEQMVDVGFTEPILLGGTINSKVQPCRLNGPMEGLRHAWSCFAVYCNRCRDGKRILLGTSVIASVVMARSVSTRGRGSTVESCRTFFVRSRRTCTRQCILMTSLALYQPSSRHVFSVYEPEVLRHYSANWWSA
jgi:hypothetical protein